MTLWGGRFSKAVDSFVEDFGASIHFDHVLAHWDIVGSVAHSKALAKAGVLSGKEQQKISAALWKLAEKIESGKIKFSLSDEDIHMNIERLLHGSIGDLAGKLHTGRSRNDQVALDLHLYLRAQVLHLLEKCHALQSALIAKGLEHIDTLLPGYTHLQRAQPVSLAHHLLAYAAMLQRDMQRLQEGWHRINVMPLGAGALAGAGFGLDRDYVAQLLAFDSLYENSMDAVSDRDFIIEFLSSASMIMMHLSRLSEELILWSSQEFAFIELDEGYSTGSSMMPQKKNPDVAELVRGKTGRVYGALMSMLTILKGLPLTYNKDLQEDKEGVFDVMKTVQDCLTVYAPMISTMKINKNNMARAASGGFSNATQVADYLVAKALPFRQAHEVAGKLVLHCIQNNTVLEELPLSVMQQYSDLIDNDIYQQLALTYVVDARNVRGGTARPQIRKQLDLIKKQSEAMQVSIVEKQK
ncbi:MAG: argininosuccinate lyase, partial [Gammaproteobacteria bacterium]